MMAKARAAAPKAAVPPSIRHACFLLTSSPQIKRALVKRRDKVALHTFLIDEAMNDIVVSLAIGRSWTTAATTARGPLTWSIKSVRCFGWNNVPRREKIKRPSRREGKSSVKKWICVIWGDINVGTGKTQIGWQT